MPEPTLVDVAARDGIQNEGAELTTAIKRELIGRITAAGIPRGRVARQPEMGSADGRRRQHLTS